MDDHWTDPYREAAHAAPVSAAWGYRGFWFVRPFRLQNRRYLDATLTGLPDGDWVDGDPNHLAD